MHHSAYGMAILCNRAAKLGHLLTNILYINIWDFALTHFDLQSSIAHHIFTNFYYVNGILPILRKYVYSPGALLH